VLARKLFATALVAAVLLVVRGARADDPATVEWSDDWTRVHPWEVASAIALTIGDSEINARVPVPTQAHWRSPILFDQWARNTFRGRTLSAQATAETVSTDLYQVGSLLPLVVDDYLAALSVHENGDVALQMFVIDMQSFGVSGLISLGAEHRVGRARPYTQSCDARDASGNLLHGCGTANDNASFFSGHAAATSTVAGLVCIDHQHLPLFGGGAADLVPCLVMIGNSIATGMLRLVADMHWASDVVTGWVVGGFSGYVLPAALHYGFGSGHPLGEVRSGDFRLVPTVMPYAGGAGAGVVGVF
jgi:hypothetical protein